MKHYINHVQSFAQGMKAVDIAAIEPGDDPILWLVEIKDYRIFPRSKPTDLFDEVAQKFRDTLAGLRIIAARSTDVTEASRAKHACAAHSIRVLFHLEQPATHTKAFPQVIDPKLAVDIMKRKMKAVDATPLVGDAGTLKGKVNWTIT